MTPWDLVYLPCLVIWCELVRFQWFRKLWGGHWELWYCEVTQSSMWMDFPECTQSKTGRDAGTRPGACFGKPECEHWAKP